MVDSFSQLYFTINLEEIFYFNNKKCRIYAAFGVSQTPTMNQLRKEKKMNINLPKYNQTVYAELLQAMVWNNKCALCAATGTGKSYIAAKFVQEAVIEQDTLILVPFR